MNDNTDNQEILENLSITKPVSTNPIRFSNVVPMDYDLAEILRRNLTFRKFEGREIATAGDGSSSAVQFLSKWGSAGSGNRQFNNPKGVAVDPDGNIYVPDTENHRIQKFDPSGGFVWDSLTNFLRDSLTEGLVGHWKFGEGSGASAADSSGEGNDATLYGPTWTTGRGGGALSFDGVDDYMAMADKVIINDETGFTVSFWIQATGTPDVMTVIRLKGSTTEFVFSWGKSGNSAVSGRSFSFGFRGNTAVGTSHSDYFLDNMQNQWYHFAVMFKGGNKSSPSSYDLYVDSSLVPLENINTIGGAGVANANMIGCDPGPAFCFKGFIANFRIYNRSLTEAEIRFLAESGEDLSGDANGLFSNPQDVAVDEVGNVYVADTENHRIQKFKSDGTFLDKWGGQGDADGQFNNPSGVAVDKGGNVYVADTGADRIQQFDSNGQFITKWGNRLAEGLLGYWKFNEDGGTIAADSSGNSNDGTLNGPTWTTGKTGGALDFDGAVDYVNVESVSWAALGTGNFSIGAWIKPRVLDGDNRIIVTDQTPGNFQLNLSAGGTAGAAIDTWIGTVRSFSRGLSWNLDNGIM